MAANISNAGGTTLPAGSILTGALANYHNNPMIDPSVGGQNGYAPNYATLSASAAHIRQPLIPVVLSLPGFLDYGPYPDKYKAIYKAMFERHGKVIEGLNNQITLDVEGTTIGFTAEEIPEFTKSAKEKTTLSYTFGTTWGGGLQNALTYWIRFGIKDPDTQSAMITKISNNVPDDYTLDMMTATIAFIEPDVRGKRCVQCWVITGVAPKTDGENVGKRDMSSGSDVPTLSIEFTGAALNNLGTAVLGQHLLDQMSTFNAVPHFRPSYIADIDPGIKPLGGYQSDVNDLSNTALTGGV